MSIIVYKDRISQIVYDEQSSNITFIEEGLATGKILLKQLEAVVEFSKTNIIRSIIFDFRRMLGNFRSTFDYLHNHYYPTLKSQGFKCNAFIVSDDIISNRLTEQLVDDLKEKGISAAIFSNTDSAGDWVNKQLHTGKPKKLTVKK